MASAMIVAVVPLQSKSYPHITPRKLKTKRQEENKYNVEKETVLKNMKKIYLTNMVQNI